MILVAAGLGISVVPESLQRMHLDGVVFRPIIGAARPTAPLILASRRGDASAAVRQFLGLPEADDMLQVVPIASDGPIAYYGDWALQVPKS